MSDIREAVARALCMRVHEDIPAGVTTDDPFDDPRVREFWLPFADAALSVARPLIEAEARERALREAAAVCMPTDRSLYDSEMRAYGDHFAGMIYALLPAPAEEAKPATSDDGWILWSGGNCPVAPDTHVTVKQRGGAWATGNARHFRWPHLAGDETAIVAYRIVEAGNEGK